jgi:hypothetical protein
VVDTEAQSLDEPQRRTYYSTSTQPRSLNHAETEEKPHLQEEQQYSHNAQQLELDEDAAPITTSSERNILGSEC